MSYVLRRATQTDLDVVVAMVEQAASWLGRRGLDQWQYPPRTARIANGILDGEVYLLDAAEQPIATITVDQNADPEFWTSDDQPQSALYVHRMVVIRAAAGRGLGSSLLDWAGERAQAAGRAWLRLDAWRTNPGLHAYYRSCGFQHVRTIELAHRGSGALFQRPAAAASGGGPEIRYDGSAGGPI